MVFDFYFDGVTVKTGNKPKCGFAKRLNLRNDSKTRRNYPENYCTLENDLLSCDVCNLFGRFGRRRFHISAYFVCFGQL